MGDITEEVKAFVSEMPEPKRALEPYFIAFAFHPKEESFKPRYFVLEKRLQLFPEDPQVTLRELTENGECKSYIPIAHKNLTEKKKITLKDFLYVIKETLEKQEV